MARNGELSVVLAFALTALSTITVALRFYSRHVLLGKLGSPDWVMLVAVLATWVSALINLYMVHFMNYNIHDQESLAVMTKGNLLTFWLYRLSYIVDLCLIKTSILLFYNHITESHVSFQRGVRAMLTIVLLGGVSMITADIFTCYPISDAWSFDVFIDMMQGKSTAKCFDITPFWFFNAAYNLVTDIIIWLMPMVYFLHLRNMPLRRRLELLTTFSVGIIAIIASACRLRTMIVFLPSLHHPRDQTADILIWSQVEQHTGIIAASLPFLRPIFRKAMLKFQGWRQPVRDPPMQPIDWPAPIPIVFRTPVIPSPPPSLGSNCDEFHIPKESLLPIEPAMANRTWGPTIWDGTQVRQVLPS